MAVLTARRTGILTAVTATLVGGALVLGASPALAGDSDPADGDRRATSEGRGSDAGREKLPPELRADLKELKEADAEERPALREEIRGKAAAGDYGDRVQRKTERLMAAVDELPDEVQAELEATQSLTGEEAKAALKTIVDGMLAGDYGTDVQEAAQDVAERVARNDAERPGYLRIILGTATQL